MADINIYIRRGHNARRLEAIYGTVEASTYSNGDVLVFHGITETGLLSGKVRLRGTPGATIDLLHGDDLDTAIDLTGVKDDIDYVIYYDEAYQDGKPLKVKAVVS